MMPHSWEQTGRGRGMWCTAQVENVMQSHSCEREPSKSSCCRLAILIAPKMTSFHLFSFALLLFFIFSSPWRTCVTASHNNGMGRNQSDMGLDHSNGRVKCNFLEKWVSCEGWKGGKGDGWGREARAQGNGVKR